MENFVAAACRTKSNWFDFVRRVAATEALGKLGNIVAETFFLSMFCRRISQCGQTRKHLLRNISSHLS